MSRTFGSCGEIIVQSGGGDIVDSVSIGNYIPSGSSGEIYSVPVSLGRRVIVTSLMPLTGSEAGIELKFGTRVVYSGSISDAPSNGSLTITQNGTTTTNEYLGVSTMLEIKGDYGEDLTITKTTGSTILDIYISHKITY